MSEREHRVFEEWGPRTLPPRSFSPLKTRPQNQTQTQSSGLNQGQGQGQGRGQGQGQGSVNANATTSTNAPKRTAQITNKRRYGRKGRNRASSVFDDWKAQAQRDDNGCGGKDKDEGATTATARAASAAIDKKKKDFLDEWSVDKVVSGTTVDTLGDTAGQPAGPEGKSHRQSKKSKKGFRGHRKPASVSGSSKSEQKSKGGSAASATSTTSPSDASPVSPIDAVASFQNQPQSGSDIKDPPVDAKDAVSNQANNTDSAGLPTVSSTTRLPVGPTIDRSKGQPVAGQRSATLVVPTGTKQSEGQSQSRREEKNIHPRQGTSDSAPATNAPKEPVNEKGSGAALNNKLVSTGIPPTPAQPAVAGESSASVVSVSDAGKHQPQDSPVRQGSFMFTSTEDMLKKGVSSSKDGALVTTDASPIDPLAAVPKGPSGRSHPGRGRKSSYARLESVSAPTEGGSKKVTNGQGVVAGRSEGLSAIDPLALAPKGPKGRPQRRGRKDSHAHPRSGSISTQDGPKDVANKESTTFSADLPAGPSGSFTASQRKSQPTAHRDGAKSKERPVKDRKNVNYSQTSGRVSTEIVSRDIMSSKKNGTTVPNASSVGATGAASGASIADREGQRVAHSHVKSEKEGSRARQTSSESVSTKDETPKTVSNKEDAATTPADLPVDSFKSTPTSRPSSQSGGEFAAFEEHKDFAQEERDTDGGQSYEESFKSISTKDEPKPAVDNKESTTASAGTPDSSGPPAASPASQSEDQPSVATGPEVTKDHSQKEEIDKDARIRQEFFESTSTSKSAETRTG